MRTLYMLEDLAKSYKFALDFLDIIGMHTHGIENKIEFQLTREGLGKYRRLYPNGNYHEDEDYMYYEIGKVTLFAIAMGEEE